MIAEPFRREEFRFIKVRKLDKKASEPNWQATAAYHFDDPKILAWIESGGNVGIRGGDGGAIILDIDASDRIFDKNIQLPASTTWETRPGRQQRLYICDDWDQVAKFVGKEKDQVKFYDSAKENGKYPHLGEIQGPRHYGVIPPSVKEVDGERFYYKMLDSREPAKISVLWLLECLKSKGCRFDEKDRLEENAAKLEQAVTTSKKRRVLYDGVEEGKKKYARKAFEEELKILSDSSEGNRNTQLNTSALKIGSLVSAGYVGEFEARRELTRTGRALGLADEEIAATIDSGLSAGMRQPRKIPEPEPEPIPQKTLSVQVEKPEKEESAATILSRLAAKNCLELWHTQGDAYITLPVNSHKEHYKVNSKAVKVWMGRLGKDLMGKTVSISAIKDAINVLEGQAIYDGKEYQLHIRKAEYEGKIYVDMGDPNWRAIEISPSGWKVVESCPIRFRRSKNSLPLPEPIRGGKLDDLRPIVNASSDENWILVKGWAMQAFWCKGPYAHLYFRGTQGTAKSYFMRCLKDISDPSMAIKRRVPKSERDAAIALGSEAIPCFDNLSGIPDGIADLFCVASTGGVSTQRALFTDDEEAIIPLHCPIIGNGIDDLGQRGDLLDRTIVIDLEPIPEKNRKPEKQIEAEIAEKRGKLLGSLLDSTVDGMRKIGTIKLPNLPRMADFAEWAYACLGDEGDAFLEAYGVVRNNTVLDLAEDNRIPAAVCEFVDLQAGFRWEGGATDLLTALNECFHIYPGQEPFGWPRSPDKMGAELRRFTPAIIAKDVSVAYARTGNKRKIVLQRVTSVIEVSRQKKTSDDSMTLDDTSFLENGNIIVKDNVESQKEEVSGEDLDPNIKLSKHSVIVSQTATDNDSGMTLLNSGVTLEKALRKLEREHGLVTPFSVALTTRDAFGAVTTTKDAEAFLIERSYKNVGGSWKKSS